MERDSVIEKVRALRALSTSSNLNEAASAAKIAEKLIQEHCLAEAELEITLGSQETPHEDGVPLTDWNQRATNWQSFLLSHLTKAYNCTGIHSWKHGKYNFYAVGRPSDIATVRYQYAFFTAELTRLCLGLAPDGMGRGEGKRWHNSFYLGGVSSIGDSLKSAKQEVRAQASSSALAVIDIHMEEALAVRAKLYPDLQSRSTSVSLDSNAYAIGKRAGSTLQSKPGLGSSVRGLLK